MAGDTNFGNVLDELKDLHELMPDMKFGEVLQAAIDSRKLPNTDLSQVSTKFILNALRKYKESHAGKRNIKVPVRRGFGKNSEVKR